MWKSNLYLKLAFSLDIYYLISIRGQFIIHLQAVFFPVDLRWSYWYMAWDIKQESSGYFLVVNTWWNYAQFWWWNWLLQTETAGASVICEFDPFSGLWIFKTVNGKAEINKCRLFYWIDSHVWQYLNRSKSFRRTKGH